MQLQTKDLLNNRWVIGSLCVAAALTVGANLVPLFSAPSFDDAELDDELEDDWLEAERQILDVRYDLGSVDTAGLTWNAPTRDPFGFAAVSPTVGSSTAAAALPEAAPSGPKLIALVAGPRVGLAVIDGKIVARGDAVGDALVREIGPEGVVLQAPGAAPLRLTVK